MNPDNLNAIVQVLAGEEINMDKFERTGGPDAHCQVGNIAKDPYTAAKYFHIILRIMLKTLMGIEAHDYSVTAAKTGIFGMVTAHFRVIESQGQGTLHIHMLVWLKGSPSVDEVEALLQTMEFRDRISIFLRQNIHAQAEYLVNEDDIQKTTLTLHLAYNRFPHPYKSSFQNEMNELDRDAAWTKQVYTCWLHQCLQVTNKHELKCKRRAPCPLARKGME